MKSDPDNLEPMYKEAAIGFVDIRGFTEITNWYDIELVNEILKLFFDAAYKSIMEEDGLCMLKGFPHPIALYGISLLLRRSHPFSFLAFHCRTV